jgi:hypothetical protein
MKTQQAKYAHSTELTGLVAIFLMGAASGMIIALIGALLILKP